MQYIYFKTKDNAEGNLDADISAVATTVPLETGDGANFPAIYRGNTTSGGSSVQLNKTGIGASGIAVGDSIENITDGSHAFVTAVNTNSLTTSELRGGSDNTWQNNDEYAAGRFVLTVNKRDVSTGLITAHEKMLVGNRSGDVLTIDQRGYGGSTPQSFDAGDYADVFVVSAMVGEISKAFGELYVLVDDVYTKSETDALIAARSWKDPVVVATTAAGTLASDFENGDTVDGVVLATGDRVLIKNQASAIENGIYTVNASGAPTRATDFDTTAEVEGAAVQVKKGTSNADTVWMCTSDNPTIGVNDINFAQVGASLTKATATEALAGSNDAKYMTPYTVGRATQRRAITLAENLTAGDVVKIISSSGTKVQKAKATMMAAQKGAVTLHANTGNLTGMLYIQKYNVFVHAWRDTSDTNKGKVIVFRVNEDGDFDFGDAVTFEANALTTYAGTSVGMTNSALAIVWDSANERLVIAYGDAGDTNKGKAIVGILNPYKLTTSWGTKVQFDAASMVGGVVAAYDSTNGKVAIGFVDAGDTNKAKAIIGTVSGTTISFGTEVTMDTGTIDVVNTAYFDSVSGQVIFVYNSSTVGAGRAILGTVSGTSISFGSASNFAAYTGDQVNVVYDTVNTKFVIVYYSGASARIVAVVATISGTSITLNAGVDVDTGSCKDSWATYDKVSGKIFVTFGISTSNYYIEGTVSGTSTSWAGKTQIGSTANIAEGKVIYHSFLGKHLYVGTNSGVKAYLITLAGVYPDLVNAGGVMQESGSLSEDKMVVLLGGVCQGFSSKTPGNKVYINDDYTLTETITPYPIGRWISDTELLVTKTP